MKLKSRFSSLKEIKDKGEPIWDFKGEIEDFENRISDVIEDANREMFGDNADYFEAWFIIEESI